ncbi:MAG: prepilin-type N-terminal cleavage/methylation domain-containing protein [Firmicutes bacterium]|nr:prepilin-type N-terminal cleavage/methylation domain-containing protein [Bacillota bacterium]
MNKKGFTLVELLAVLIVLAILATIATTTIIKQVKESKKTLNEAQKSIVKTVAIEYATKKGLFKQEGNTYNICLKDLEKEALIDKNIVNSLNKNKNYYLKLTVECDNICSFKAQDIMEYKDNEINCN